MTRFAALTIVFIVVVVGVVFVASEAVMWWGVAAVSGAYVVSVGLGVAFIRLRLFGPAICRGERGGMQIALTFDDGPDPAATPALLRALEENAVKATFFCVGENVRAEPELAKRIVSEGHLIANHSHRHAWWTNFLTGRALLNEITLAQEAMEETTGVRPAYYRPPVGLTNPSLSAVLKKADLACVGWDVRGLDRHPRCWETIVRRVTRKTADGSIVVLHDGGADATQLVAIVSGIIARLRGEGYNLVRLDELLGAGNERDRS